MRQALSVSIVASAALSVVVAAILLTLAVHQARPVLRDAFTEHTLGLTDLDACERDPAAFGDPSGPVRYFAYDEAGRSRNPAAPPLEEALLARASSTGRVARADLTGPYAINVYPTGRSGPCAILRAQSREPQGVLIWRFLGLLGLSTFGGVVLASLATWGLVVEPLRQRIEALALAAGDVGMGRFAAPTPGTDALGRIADVLSRSHDRILHTQEALEARNRALEDHLAGIAHDLRTPLASMQLALEALAGESGVAERRTARRALADSVYLAALVENLHQGVRLRHDVDVGAGTVDLVDLVRRLEQRFAIIGRHADVEVAASVPEGPVHAACTPTLAERAIANLVQNAIEHNPGQGHVAILLEHDAGAGRFSLRVEDDGPGLPEGMMATLASETFLVDPARRRGPGLGMLITAEIAQRAGWTVEYVPRAPNGLVVRLTGDVVRA